MLPNDFFIQYLLKQGLVHPEHLQRAQDIQAQRGGDLIDILFGMMAMQREQQVFRQEIQTSTLSPMHTHEGQAIPNLNMMEEPVEAHAGAPAVMYRDLSAGQGMQANSAPAPQVWGNSYPSSQEASEPPSLAWPSMEEIEVPMMWSANSQPVEAFAPSPVGQPTGPLPEPLPIPQPSQGESGASPSSASSSSLRNLFNTLQTIVGIELPEDSFRKLEAAYDAHGDRLNSQQPVSQAPLQHPWMEEMSSGVERASLTNVPAFSEQMSPPAPTPHKAKKRIDPRIAAAVDNRYSSDAIPAPQHPLPVEHPEPLLTPSNEGVVPYRINGNSGSQQSVESDLYMSSSHPSRERARPSYTPMPHHAGSRSQDAMPLIQGSLIRTPAPQSGLGRSHSSASLQAMPTSSSHAIRPQFGYKSQELPGVRSHRSSRSSYSLAPVIEGVESHQGGYAMSSTVLPEHTNTQEATTSTWRWFLFFLVALLGLSLVIGGALTYQSWLSKLIG